MLVCSVNNSNMDSLQEIDDVVSVAETLSGADLQNRSVNWIREQLTLLVANYKGIGIGRSSEQVWYRARKCSQESGFSNLLQMIYPPADKIGFNRANLPGVPVLYASWNVMTVLDEIGAEVDDHIQIVALRPVAGVDLPCHIVGEYQSINNSGGWLVNSRELEQLVNKLQHDDPLRHMKALYVDSFLAEAFRRRVLRPYDYKITAVYADKFHKAKGGFMYPSVQTAGGMNIAVPAEDFDAKFEIISAQILKIDRCFGYGLYTSKLLKSTCDFNADGTIIWNSSRQSPAQWNLQVGLRTSQPFVGWRKPK